MTRSPTDSLDTVDSAPADETVPINEVPVLAAALAKAGAEIDAFIADVAAADLRRLRRDPDLPAVRCVEDLFPETSLFKSMLNAVGIGDVANVVVLNRQFKEECYDARMLTGRACMALIGQDCEQNATEARKWYRVCADMHGTREALCMRGAMANEGGASSVLTVMVSSLGEAAVDLDESERCLRAAIAADDSHPGSYWLLAPAGHALDAAKVDLAMTLATKAWRSREPGADRLSPDVLVETSILLDEVLGHDAVPSVHDVPFRDPRREATTLKAQMIHKGELAGTPSDVLALMEAIPQDKLDANCNYLLGEVYKKLDEETPNDEHARRAFDHLRRAFEERHPRTPFELGQLTERGRGTEAHLPRAYYMYIMAAVHAEDERAVALLAERSAAGPPYPPELVAALSEFTQFPGDETATLDALAALGVGAHSSSDDDSD